MGNLLVVDLEATCSRDATVPKPEMEIIEIGAVMVDTRSFTDLSELQTFVRPVRHPKLTPFCTELTTITQAEVDGAEPFPAVLQRFVAWATPFAPFRVGSWGEYDRKQIAQDCAFHGLPYPFESEHLNLKRLFTERQGLDKRLGMSGALRLARLELLGTHHRGIDDARNIARLLPFILGDRRI